MVQTEKFPVTFFDHIEEVGEQLKNKEVFVFLDYDGSLTPIVDTPDLAVLSVDMRQTVERLASKYKVSVVSGRATDDVREKVKIDGIFYAGSHGFEIIDPEGNVTINQEAQAMRPTIDAVYEQLSESLRNISGALVEHVKYTISTHYRLVSDDDLNKVEKAVDKILKEYPELHVTQGKKVFEIRPKVKWDKGRAVRWILNVFEFDRQKHIAVYVGDDATDEDAFAVLEEKGFGILVADPSRESKARYYVKDIDEVKKVLEYFIENSL